MTKNIIIIGDQGTGKTTILNKLASQYDSPIILDEAANKAEIFNTMKYAKSINKNCIIATQNMNNWQADEKKIVDIIIYTNNKL